MISFGYMMLQYYMIGTVMYFLLLCYYKFIE